MKEHQEGTVYCPICHEWGDLVPRQFINKGKVRVNWWVFHKGKKHKAPDKTYPSEHIEQLVKRSLAEVRLEKILDKRHIPFKAQKRIDIQGGHVTVDFLVDDKVIVECEGRVHQERLLLDEVRQKMLESCGYKVIRFSNIEIFDHIDLCVKKVREALQSS